MRSKLSTLFSAFVVMIGLVSISHQAQASLSAANAFATLRGNTTIDSGGAMHSQARSIYSLGGGMTSFKGKKVTFLAVDPPSFSAGCSGISWHFGGFSFISMDELRQLVEAISQAALGIAVDLAMQTLCPQCYAVMSKLRDMANMMRNAAADSCKAGKAIGRALVDAGKSFFGGGADSSTTVCSEETAAAGKSSGWLDSAAGKLCRSVESANNAMAQAGRDLLDWVDGKLDPSKKTPGKDKLDRHFNMQYEVLTALGLQDGVLKDLLLNYTGMAIYYPEPVTDCTAAFHLFKATPVQSDGSVEDKLTKGSQNNQEVSGGDKGSTKQANTEASAGKRSFPVCHAPPRLTGVQDIALRLVCGFDPLKDAETFIHKHSAAGSLTSQDAVSAAILAFAKSSSFAKMCGLHESAASNLAGSKPGAATLRKEDGNPKLYTCRKGENADCLKPGEKTYRELVGDTEGQFTGLGWLIADALYLGVERVAADQPLPGETIAVLNGSGYPLYRLINMAAVYPGLATDLINSYSAAIAVQYSVDTLDKLLRPGQISAAQTKAGSNGIGYKEILAVRHEIANTLYRDGEGIRNRVQALLAEKRSLVQMIVQVNRALQSEVISQGMMGNAGLAISIKKRISGSQNP